MSYLVPAMLGGLVLFVIAGGSIFASFAKRRDRRRADAKSVGPKILVHSINDDRCTGCDACVAVCPTNVLGLVQNKSRVLTFQDCIQCEACMWACPTEALVMHRQGDVPPPIKVPELDPYYQTAVPGQYLIGEVAGKPLVKNAANLGRVVIEHMVANGLQAKGDGQQVVDVVIVGSGPGGLSAALTCVRHGLSYVVLEKENFISSTVSRYPKGKLIMAEPYECENLSFLPVFDSSKEEIVPVWQETIERVGMNIRMRESVQVVRPVARGLFEVATTASSYRGQRVVLATGLRGKPRTLGVPGENLPKVASMLEDPNTHRGQAVCVVGGGDSALEAAMALADAGARVLLSYRGRNFQRAQPKNRQRLESYEAQRKLRVLLQSEIIDFGPDTVTVQLEDGVHKRFPNHATFVLIGADPPVAWLSTLGIQYVERPHMQAMPAPDALIRQLIGSALPCPDTAAEAAALARASQDPVASPQRSPELAAEPRSGRNFSRPASKMFRRRRSSERPNKPVPLSEFVRRARHPRGDGHRDALDPQERTRVLRMLRDEGGRMADEASHVEVVVDAVSGTDQHQRPPTHLPSLSGNGEARRAVVVGLAQAKAQSKVSKRRVDYAFGTESTRNIDVGEVDRLLEEARGADRGFDEEATHLSHYDAGELMALASIDEYERGEIDAREAADSAGNETRDVAIEGLDEARRRGPRKTRNKVYRTS